MKGKVLRGFLAAFLALTLPMGSVAVPESARAAETAEVSVVTSGNKVTIGNEYISREFSIAGDKLNTTKLINKRTDNGETVFIPAEGSEEFKIRMTKTSEPFIDRTGWTATADSYENAEGATDGDGDNLIDNDLTSIWHTNYGGGAGNQSFPYNVIFTLGKSTTFQSFSYTPRSDNSTNGNLKDYELYYSTSDTTLSVDSSEWILLKSGSFTYDGVNPIYVNLDAPCTATQLKLKALSANNGLSFGGGADFKLHEQQVLADDGMAREFASSALTLAGKPVVEDTTATINNVEKIGKKVTFHFEPYTFKDVTYTISETIVMYNGDNFMRKYMEISVPEEQKADAVIDYIDLESLKVNSNDATWTIPTTAGEIVMMSQFKANLGQPIYIQGMFLGCEFPAADTEIVDGIGYMRYYTGKSFERLEADNQLTKDGKYVTWQTVAGAARSSTENEVIQADFFEYIKSIATPSEFRIQYNSWFDNMMFIDDEEILDSFIEMDRELNQVEVRPLDSYVVDDGWANYNDTSVIDAGRCGTTLNQTGFWEFNNKFPDGLTPSSQLVKKFGSNFGVWVGPRGGYNFYGSLANILTKSGKGSKAGGSIDVADRTYVKHFTEMATNWMKEYDVNYWKWDGFADSHQYGAFAAADGVPGYANRHMIGGYENMYHVTDLWEAWIDLMEAVRQCEKEEGINKLWISLTCYTNPSPWFLQWANSVWIQCTNDQADAGNSSSKMDRQMNYRDACYYDFLKNHQFQFPLSNIYNHDPVYGKRDTGMDINTATDEQFRNYLYMQSTRGTAFWELYYSDSMMTEGKYEITGEFLAWAEENHHMLKNSKMFGASPNEGIKLGGISNGAQHTYGYACFDGTDGIISFRNPSTSTQDLIFTFDRTMGVPEDAGTLQYHMEHSHNLTSGTDTTGTLTYGQSYTLTLQPDEVRILRVSKEGDTTSPKILRAYSDGEDEVTVKFSEKVNAGTFKINGVEAEAAAESADGITFHITAAEGSMTDGEEVDVTAEDVTDLADNALTEKTITFTYHEGNEVVNRMAMVKGQKVLATAEDSLQSRNGFAVSAEVYTVSTGTIVSQGSDYEIGINKEGNAYFTLNGTTAVSSVKVNDGEGHVITGEKENNGIQKIYVDGVLAGSAYNADNRYYEVKAADIMAGSKGFSGVVNVTISDTALGYDKVEELYADEPVVSTGEQNWASGKTVTAKWVADGSNAASNTDRPMTNVVDGVKNTDNYGEFGADGNTGSAYLQVDLGEVRNISKVNLYRYWSDSRTYDGTVVVLSETEDFAEKTVIYNSDAANFHGFGEGKDATYAESSSGKSISLENEACARYVRVYMHGQNSTSTTNHIVELEVIGSESVGDADYSKVDAALEIANSLNKEEYVDFTAVDAATAAVVRGKDATQQAEVNAMASAIFKAIAELKELKEVAKTDLQTALNDAKAEDTSSYTAESVAKYQALLAEAEAVLNNENATADELNAAVKKIQSAKAVLVKAATPPEKDKVLAVNTVFEYKNISYRVVVADAVNGEVAVVKALKKKAKQVIPSTVEKDGYTFKVTQIDNKAFAKNAKLKTLVIGKNVAKIGKMSFYGCKKLKKIVIKTTKLTKKGVGAGAFKKIHAKATVKVPKKKWKAYKSILKSKGLSKKAKIKK